MKAKTYIIIAVTICFLLLVVGILLFHKENATLIEETKQTTEKIIASPTPTPFQFEELTIPYLRAKSYPSSLGELQPYQQNSNYSSYLTTYTSDGLTIHGLLTQPKGEKPPDGWPAIVFVHGYIPPTLYKTTERYIEYVNYLASRGFVVFKIDLRGHGDSEGQPGGAYTSSDYVIDTLNAYSALETSSFVNPKAIGLWGHSMAGNVVMRSVAARPTIPAAVIWAGAVYSYTDQQTYGINDQSYRPPILTTPQQNTRRRIMEIYGQPSKESPFWKLVAPVNYLSDLKGAIEIHHAKDDSVVNINYSRDLVAELDKTTIPHEFYEYPSGGHNLEGSSFSQAMLRTVDFYKKYLQ